MLLSPKAAAILLKGTRKYNMWNKIRYGPITVPEADRLPAAERDGDAAGTW